jgi:hypothetical protein
MSGGKATVWTDRREEDTLDETLIGYRADRRWFQPYEARELRGVN